MVEQPVEDAVQLMAVHECKADNDEIPDLTAKFVRCGWQPSFAPCSGHGKNASAGVALLARPGVSIRPLRSEECGVCIPRGHFFFEVKVWSGS